MCTDTEGDSTGGKCTGRGDLGTMAGSKFGGGGEFFDDFLSREKSIKSPGGLSESVSHLLLRVTRCCFMKFAFGKEISLILGGLSCDDKSGGCRLSRSFGFGKVFGESTLFSNSFSESLTGESVRGSIGKDTIGFIFMLFNGAGEKLRGLSLSSSFLISTFGSRSLTFSTDFLSPSLLSDLDSLGMWNFVSSLGISISNFAWAARILNARSLSCSSRTIEGLERLSLLDDFDLDLSELLDFGELLDSELDLEDDFEVLGLRLPEIDLLEDDLLLEGLEFLLLDEDFC